MFCNLFDSHTHSENSFDGLHSVIFMCEQAIHSGLLGIAVTDHFDIDLVGEHHNLERMRQSYFGICKARAAYGSGFIISCGVELGEPDADYALADRVLAAVDYDVVLGSVHTLPDGTDPYLCDFTEDDPYRVLDGYFARLLTLTEWGGYDVLAHLTYPLRYCARDGRLDVDLKRYDDVIDEILRRNAQQGKALEINTSGLRDALGDLMPTYRYFKRFRELGGEAITIGSDAHRAEHVGANLEEAMRLAQVAGFRYFAFYKHRIPRMMRLM